MVIYLEGEVVETRTFQPVPFVRVGMDGIFSTTNEQGKFKFMLPTPGVYTLSVRSPMHQPFTDKVTLNKDGITKTVRIELNLAWLGAKK